MKYQVPQFIEVEDKIFGPLTWKQFLYVAGGAALGFIIWSVIPIRFLAIIIAAPIIVFFLAMAFYPVNGRPFSIAVENAIKYYFGTKLYIWHQTERKIEPTGTSPQSSAPSLDVLVPKLSDSKLKELSWSLDIKENFGDSSPTNKKFKV